MAPETLRLGIAGLGKACQLMLPSVLAHAGIELVAVADADESRAARCAREFGVAACGSVEELAAEAAVDAVYVATPHQFHAEHAITAAAHGKHVLVEKPMALSLGDCESMIGAAERHGVALVVGHTHGASASTLFVRELVASGRFGGLRSMLGVNFTDYLYRPRRPEELDTRLGGGVLFNQLPHHVDTVRSVHPTGAVAGVSARADRGHPAPGTEGAYSALIDLDGVAATVVYSGHGYFDTDDWYGWAGESGYAKDHRQHQRAHASASAATSRRPVGARSGEALSRRAALEAAGERMAGLPHFGVLVASLDRADLVTVAQGVLAVGPGGRELLTPARERTAPKRETLDELRAAALGTAAPLHDGRWGRETVAACLAALASARWGRHVALDGAAPTSIAEILDGG